jgi:hypothetical protein
MAALITRSVTEPDQPRWRELFYGYAAFYKSPIDDDIAARVWAGY